MIENEEQNQTHGGLCCRLGSLETDGELDLGCKLLIRHQHQCKGGWKVGMHKARCQTVTTRPQPTQQGALE